MQASSFRRSLMIVAISALALLGISHWSGPSATTAVSSEVSPAVPHPVPPAPENSPAKTVEEMAPETDLVSKYQIDPSLPPQETLKKLKEQGIDPIQDAMGDERSAKEMLESMINCLTVARTHGDHPQQTRTEMAAYCYHGAKRLTDKFPGFKPEFDSRVAPMVDSEIVTLAGERF